jgi:hypothetical protein
MIIRTPTEQEKREFWGMADGERNDPRIRDVKGAFVNGKMVGVAGVMRHPAFFGSIFEEDGPWIGFLQMDMEAKVSGAAIVVEMRHYLKTQTEPILIQHDDAFPQAKRLLEILGFRPTHLEARDLRNSSRILRIWKWQPSPQLRQ